MKNQRIKILIRDFVVGSISALIVLWVVNAVSAGSLNPTSSPASTLKDLDALNSALVGTYDSSTTASSSTGSAIQIGRCILEKMNGGSC